MFDTLDSLCIHQKYNLTVGTALGDSIKVTIIPLIYEVYEHVIKSLIKLSVYAKDTGP